MNETLRTALVVLATASVTSVLLPVEAQAAGQLMTIVDPSSDSKARVDAGRLRVGDGLGPLSVDGSVSSVPAGRPLQVWLAAGSSTGSADVDSSTEYTVPAGKEFVVTHISGTAVLPDGQAVTVLHLLTHEDAIADGGLGITARHMLAPENYVSANGKRTFTFEDSVLFTATSGARLHLVGDRSHTTGSASLNFHVSGYLRSLPVLTPRS